MFRVEMHQALHTLTMQIEGQLSGNSAEYTRTLLTGCEPGLKLVVDLTDVTFVDALGEEVLLSFGRAGAEFMADNAYARFVCERLSLPLARAADHTRKHNNAH